MAKEPVKKTQPKPDVHSTTHRASPYEASLALVVQSPALADYFEAACGIEPWASEAQARRNRARVELGAEPEHGRILNLHTAGTRISGSCDCPICVGALFILDTDFGGE